MVDENNILDSENFKEIANFNKEMFFKVGSLEFEITKLNMKEEVKAFILLNKVQKQLKENNFDFLEDDSFLNSFNSLLKRIKSKDDSEFMDKIPEFWDKGERKANYITFIIMLLSVVSYPLLPRASV